MKATTKSLLGAVCLATALLYFTSLPERRTTAPYASTISQPVCISSTSLKARATLSPAPATQTETQVSPSPVVNDTELNSNEQVFSAFDQWVEDYLSATATGLEREGELLAAERRSALVNLIQSDPGRAVTLTVPFSIRQQLPASIQQQLEERVSGRANFDVIASLPAPNSLAQNSSIDRYVTLNDRTFKAFVYGRRLTQTSKESIPLHGIALDGKLALHESPVRVLEAGELADPSLVLPAAGALCPISKSAGAPSAAVQVGSEVVYLCHDGHIETLTRQLEAAESGIGPLTRQSMAPAWSTGPKRVLLMRVNFPDDLSVTLSDADAQEMMNQVNAFFVENSYGKVSISARVTPVLTLPNPKAYYISSDADYALRQILADARLAASAIGIAPSSYDLDCVQNAICTGRAYVGVQGASLHDKDVSTACHELGHNLGAWHANSWKTTDGTIIGAGYNREYGNPYDTMGSGRKYQFNAYYKNLLNWLPNTGLQTVTEDGIYRLYPFDVPTLEDGRTYGLIIRKDNLRNYWIETRQSLNSFFPGSLLLNWSPWYGSASGTQLLDATPTSQGSFFDAPFALGQTFHDPELGLKIIPLTTTSESVDVLVKYVHYLLAQSEPNTLQSMETSTEDPAPSVADFAIDIAAAGDYQLYTHLLGSYSDPAFVVSVDNSSEKRDVRLETEATADRPWVRTVEFSSQDGSLTPALLSLAAGKHTIRVEPRNPNIQLKTILLTDDPTEDLPPLIPKISERAVTPGEKVAIPFSVAETRSASSSVNVMASFSNPSLLAGGYILTNLDQTWTLIFTAASNRAGTAIVTLTAMRTDGSSSVTKFSITIPKSAPKPSASLATRRESDGTVTVILSKLSTPNWTIQATEDFLNWEDLASISAEKTTAEFKDTLAPQFTRRFYRALAR